MWCRPRNAAAISLPQHRISLTSSSPSARISRNIRSKQSRCSMTMLVQPVSSSSEWAREGGSSETPLISVVVPVYKEETNIRPFLERAVPVLEGLGPYEVLFCLDPSPDQTEAVILAEIERNPRIGLLVFSRRFGQPAAT